MSQDFFTPSIIPWFRDRADDVIRNILLATFQNNPGVGDDIFRPAEVVDETSQQVVPTPVERLIRWDDRHPNDVFWFGFQPWVTPEDGEYPTTAFDLGSYVAEGSSTRNSIFVGTARYYRNDAGRLVRWQPRRSVRFEYEVFAYGGIEVNHVLGTEHEYANQHEIAFPGGILPQFIRSAREFRDGRLLRIWDNPRFDNLANPAASTPPLDAYPAPIRGLQVPVIFFTQRDGAVDPDVGGRPDTPPRDPYEDGELRRRRRSTDEDAMREAGDAEPDDNLEGTPAPRASRACMLHPSDGGRAYFFYSNRYIVIDVNPGTTGDTIAWGPQALVGNWPSLLSAGFGNIDAVLPSPNNSQEMYFFCLEEYALIDTMPGSSADYIINGPKNIAQEWPSLREAGFTTVDAVLPNPANKEEAYFFSGDQYVLINIQPGTNDDYIINGPKSIRDNWPSLASAGFDVVDAVLPNPDNSDEAYFFSGENYALINIQPGTTDDYIVNGPKLVRTEWPSLHEAEFW